MTAQGVPKGYHTVTPYLIVRNTVDAIEFYKQAFGALELMRLAGESGKVHHAEIEIGDSPIMLADEFPDTGLSCPQSPGGAAAYIHLYVDDVDTVFSRAIAAGAKELRRVKDRFYGDRSGTLQDPFGHVWSVSTRQEDLSPEEICRRAAAFLKESGV